MAEFKDTKMEKLSLVPDALTSQELLRIPLAVLTNNVAPTLPNAEVLVVFAQWLTIHCVNPGPLAQDWMATSEVWAHALNYLNFSAPEITHVLDTWKHFMLKFGQICSASRPLPTNEEIMMWYGSPSVKAFLSTGQVEYHGHGDGDVNMGSSRGGVTCIRCCVPGHYVYDCLTSLNPAFDSVPADTYTCTICHMSGDHYEFLCPHNEEPLSLTQQRRVAFAALRHNDLASNDGYDDDVESDAESFSYASSQLDYGYDSSKGNRSPDRMPAMRARSVKKSKNIINRKRGRPLSSSIMSKVSRDGSPTPDKKQSLRRRMERIAVYEDKLANGKKLKRAQFEMIKKKANTQQELGELDEKEPGIMDTFSENVVQFNGHFHRLSLSSETSGLASLDTLSSNQPKTPSGTMGVATYNEFTQKLLNCRRSEMTTTVDVIKSRASALEKWELLKTEMATSGIDVSSDPFLDEPVAHTQVPGAQYNKPLSYGTHQHGAVYSLPATYEHQPYHHNRVAIKTSQSTLLDNDDEFLSPCRAPLGYGYNGHHKSFDPVIARPSRTKL